MSENRMAGSKEFRDKIEERKGTEWYDEALKVGELHDPRIDSNGNKEMYSGAEIRAEMRHGRGDMTTEELTKQYEQDYASGKINLNGNAKDFLREHHGATLVRNKDGGSDSEVGIPTPTPDTNDPIDSVVPSPEVDAGVPDFFQPGPGSGNINNYQNINTEANFTGDNNNVNQQIDASVGNRYGSGGSFKDAWMKDYFA